MAATTPQIDVSETRPDRRRSISESNIPCSPTFEGLAVSVPSRPPNTPRQSSYNKKSGNITPIPMPTNANIPGASVTELRVGQTAKQFYAHTDLLSNRSPYFRSIFASHPADAGPTPMSFPDLDEFAFALFVRWLYGAMLNGPSSYHSMQQYLALYILALRFKIERLQNEVMDMVRMYYRTENMTAPPYRLEYLYANTDRACMMRKFLVGTAAYRAICEGTMSQSIKEIVSGGGEVSVDMAMAIIDCHKNGLVDYRRGLDCVWHEHHDSTRCKAKSVEPWQNV